MENDTAVNKGFRRIITNVSSLCILLPIGFFMLFVSHKRKTNQTENSNSGSKKELLIL